MSPGESVGHSPRSWAAASLRGGMGQRPRAASLRAASLRAALLAACLGAKQQPRRELAVVFDRTASPVSNCYVAPEPGDVVSAEPRAISARVAWAAVIVLLAAALAGAATALHYREVAITLRHQLRPTSAPGSPGIGQLTLASRTVELPPSGALTGEVTVSSAQSVRGPKWIALSAHITGGRPHTRYALTGNDCASNAADHSWATGITDQHGSADLSGGTWTVAPKDEYWLWLSPSSQTRVPGLHGGFAPGHALSAFPAGEAPCALPG